MTPEQAQMAEDLRREAEALLDRWYPGTGVTVDWTGDVYLLQVARGYRLAAPIWVRPERLGTIDALIALRGELVRAAWRLATPERSPVG
jgi:hypothetical protein